MIQFRIVMLFICLIGLAGCGPAPPLSGIIGGVVLSQGKPVDSGTVEFHSDDPEPVTADILEDGTYSAEFSSDGSYRVAIISPDVSDRFADPESSGLTVDVDLNSGPQIADFELTK